VFHYFVTDFPFKQKHYFTQTEAPFKENSASV